MTVALRMNRVSFSYSNGSQIFSGLDLEVREGEVLSVVGPSGGGKSTLLHLLAGIEKPTSGAIEWSGDIASRTDRRPLSLVFQRDTVFPWRTVEQNISFGLDYVDISREDRRSRIDWLLKLGRLSDVRHAYPKHLSGGMRRRVALLMGIAPLPRVVLLDEPFAALDEPTRVGVHKDLLEIVYELGLTLVLVTHDIGEAVSISDRILLLSGRPSSVTWEFQTNLGRPRDVLSVRELESYAECYAETWRHLWAADADVRRTTRQVQ
jgi:NitT/TauT family transport system ATP-binding protein